MIRTLGLSLLSCALLAACETAPDYRAAPRADAEGYRDLQIEQNRFRVSYRADGVDKAADYALLRAAEVTLTAGYDWFEVVSANTEGAPTDGGGVRPSISIGGSTGSYGSSVGLGVGIGVGGSRSSGDVVRSLEFVTGTGPKPDSPNAYDARAVAASLSGR